MLSISATAEWRAAHPGGAIGLLELSGVENARGSFQLDARKRQTEARLRERYRGFTRQDFLALPVMAAYAQYYKRFGKTYHVLLQLESIVHKGKGLPNVSPLVDANFTAEVETLVLTAGHDVAKLHGEISIDTAQDGDHLAQMTGGTRKAIPAGDMIMRDAEGICCSIIYGQDSRSPISAATSHLLYVAYAPAGVPRETVSGIVWSRSFLFASSAIRRRTVSVSHSPTPSHPPRFSFSRFRLAADKHDVPAMRVANPRSS